MKIKGQKYTTSTGYNVEIKVVKDGFCVCYLLDEGLNRIPQKGVLRMKWRPCVVSNDKLTQLL